MYHHTPTPTTTPAPSSSQATVPPHDVPPEMRGDSSEDVKKKEELLLGKVAPHYKKKVGELFKLFEQRTPPDKKAERGRQPPNQDRKTTYNGNITRKNKSDIQCDPVETDENNCENVKFRFSDLRRQPLDVFTVLKNCEMHDLPANDDTVEHESCAASEKVKYQKENAFSQRKGIELPLQPSSPPQELLKT